MLKKLFSQLQSQKAPSEELAAGFRTISEAEWHEYSFLKLLSEKIFETEADLHNEEDSLTIATRVMRTACEFYDADWCGILIADLQTQAFKPEIWYEVGLGPMKETLFNDIEFTEEFATWAEHLIAQKPLIIPDAEEIKESSPMEYAAYQRLDARSIMGVPFGQHPLGFMVIRNMNRYCDRPEPLQLACFVAMMMLEQVRRSRAEKLTHMHEENDGKFHLRYNILGRHNIVVNGHTVYEQDLAHPNRRAWIVLLYMVLHRHAVDQQKLIAENWPDDPEDAAKVANRQAIFRLHSDLAAYHDIKVVDARNGKLQFSEDVRVTTDAEEMEELLNRAKHTSNEDDRIVLLKKACSLYRGRLFEQGEEDVGSWIATYAAHYNQVYVDIMSELLNLLGRHKDYRCIMDYAPAALEIEPGIQNAYIWIAIASDSIGNSMAKDQFLQKAKDALTEEEYDKVLHVIETMQHRKSS